MHGRGVGGGNTTIHEHHMNLKLKSGELKRLVFPAAPRESEARTHAAGGAHC